MNSRIVGLKNRQVLLTALAIGLVGFSEYASAQADLPGPLSYPSSTSNTVSVNQLLGSNKSLRSVSRAHRLLIDGRLDQAQKEITKALHESPNCALAIDIQGLIHYGAGNFDDAAIEFQKTIDLDPTIGQPYVGLGMILISRSRFKEALVPLDRARSILPTTWLVYFETAVADLQLGDIPSALKQISYAENLAAPDSDMRSATAYVQALVSIKQQDYENATRHLQDVINFDPAGSYKKRAQAKIDQIKSLLNASEKSQP
jgi:tetratricopeptide (TPR) repeat protein